MFAKKKYRLIYYGFQKLTHKITFKRSKKIQNLKIILDQSKFIENIFICLTFFPILNIFMIKLQQ